MKKSTLWILSAVAVTVLLAAGARWSSQRAKAPPSPPAAPSVPTIELAQGCLLYTSDAADE